MVQLPQQSGRVINVLFHFIYDFFQKQSVAIHSREATKMTRIFDELQTEFTYQEEVHYKGWLEQVLDVCIIVI